MAPNLSTSPSPPLPTPLVSSSAYDQSRLLNHLRTVERGLRARLRSIEYDASVALQLYNSLFDNTSSVLPLFANARAGSWYVPHLVNSSPTFTSAFKSADGHYGQWSSSLRRPNIHVFREAVKRGGVVIVDVTRTGKSFPDSFKKTVPIWCCVLNIIAGLTPCSCSSAQEHPVCEKCISLHLHPSVPPSEKFQILARLPHWVKDWTRSTLRLKSFLTDRPHPETPLKPLRPIWLSPNSKMWQSGLPVAHLDFIPVICISASRVIEAGDRSYIEPRTTDLSICNVQFPSFHAGFPYVQGAGDDEEAWCNGLTPALFWNNRKRFMDVADSSCQGVSHVQIEAELRRLIEHVKKEASETLQISPIVSPTLVDKAVFVPVWSSGLFLVNNGASNISTFLKATRESFPCKILLGTPESDTDKRKIQSELEKSHEEGDTSTRHLLLTWFDLKDKRSKTDYKYGFGRAMGPALTLLRETCVYNRQNALLCDVHRTGDWTSALAIAWLAWHCQPVSQDPNELLSSEVASGSEEDDCDDLPTVSNASYEVVDHEDDGVEFISKEHVHGVMLHFMATFPQFQLSRATLKQLNRFFSSPAPSSSVAPR